MILFWLIFFIVGFLVLGAWFLVFLFKGVYYWGCLSLDKSEVFFSILGILNFSLLFLWFSYDFLLFKLFYATFWVCFLGFIFLVLFFLAIFWVVDSLKSCYYQDFLVFFCFFLFYFLSFVLISVFFNFLSEKLIPFCGLSVIFSALVLFLLFFFIFVWVLGSLVFFLGDLKVVSWFSNSKSGFFFVFFLFFLNYFVSLVLFLGVLGVLPGGLLLSGFFYFLLSFLIRGWIKVFVVFIFNRIKVLPKFVLAGAPLYSRSRSPSPEGEPSVPGVDTPVESDESSGSSGDEGVEAPLVLSSLSGEGQPSTSNEAFQGGLDSFRRRSTLPLELLERDLSYPTSLTNFQLYGNFHHSRDFLSRPLVGAPSQFSVQETALAARELGFNFNFFGFHFFLSPTEAYFWLGLSASVLALIFCLIFHFLSPETFSANLTFEASLFLSFVTFFIVTVSISLCLLIFFWFFLKLF